MKKVLSFVLAFAMVLGLIPAISFAANEPLEIVVADINKWDSGIVNGTITEADPGDTIVVTVGVKNNSQESIEICGVSAYLMADSAIFTAQKTGKSPFKSAWYTKNGTTLIDEELDWSLTTGTPVSGVLALVGAGNADNAYELEPGETMTYAKVALTISSEASAQDYVFGFYTEGSYKNNASDSEDNIVSASTGTKTLTIKGESGPSADETEFASYKDTQKAAADALAQAGDSAECTALITTAKAAIDALTYDSGKTLDQNKALVDDVITQLGTDLTAQRAADALAADKAEFDSYKITKKSAAEALAQAGDSAACATLITNAKSAIDALVYDESKSLTENKAAIDAIVTDLTSALTAQRAADALAADKAEFDSYKITKKSAAEALAQAGDSDACTALITTAKNDIDALTYDESKSLVENKAAIDAIVTALTSDLATQRAADELATDKAAFDAYKGTQKSAADALAQAGDSAECATLITNAKAAIDALTYDEAKSLADNKALVDAVITQLGTDLTAQRAADALAADKAEFDSYKITKKSAAEALAQVGDSAECATLITNAKNAIDALVYDESKSLTENKAAIDAIVTQLISDLASQRAADQLAADKAEFASYKTTKKSAADALAQAGDSDTCATLITNAKAAIDALTYDESKSLAENKAAIDAIVTQLTSDLATQRAADQASAEIAEYASYKTTKKSAAEALAQAGDSAACATLITNAKNAIDALVYDDAKSLAQNKAAIDAIVTQLISDLASQRAADKLASDKAEFKAYKISKKTYADNLKQDGDPDACSTLIFNAKSAINALNYNEYKTLAENKELVDAVIADLIKDLNTAREAQPVVGTVYASDGVTPKAGVKAELKKGGQAVAETLTDAEGKFSFTVADGVYTVTVTDNDSSETQTSVLFTVPLEESFNITLPETGKNSVVNNAGAGEFAAEIGGLEAVADSQTVGADETVTITMTVEKKAADESDSEQNAIREEASQNTVEFIEFTLEKTVETSTDTETVDIGSENVSLLTIVIPFNSIGKTNIALFRYHGAAVDMLTESANASGEYITVDNYSITIHALKFSTYGIAYDTPTGAVTLSCENVEVYVGDETVISVNIENNPGFSAVWLTPVYDSNVFEIDAENGTLFGHFEENINYIWAEEEGADVTATGTLFSITLSVKDDAPAGDYTIKLTPYQCYNAEEQDVEINELSFTVTVKNLPVLTSAVADKTEVTVDGTVGATASLTAKDENGTAVTGVTWSVSPADKGVTVSADGTVTVDAKAKAGSYTFTATADGTTVSGGPVSTAAFTVVRATSVATTVTISGGQAQMTVPALGAPAAVSEAFTATVKDQYGDDMTTTVTWTIDPPYTGASVSADGKVTITDEAVAIGTVTVKATAGAASATTQISLTKDDSVATSIVIAGGQSEIVLPAPGEAAITSTAFTAKVYDQYGIEIDSPVTFTIDPAKTGVSISADGKVTITDAASVGTVTVKATSGTASATANVTVSKATPVATTLTISGGVSAMEVPALESAPALSTAFTATVYDQYGDEMTTSVTWTIEPEYLGVTVSGGVVSVYNKAIAGSFTVKATAGTASSTASVTLTDNTFDLPVLDSEPQIFVSNVRTLDGKTVSVDVYVKNNPGFASLTLKPFFPEELTLTGVQNGDLISGFALSGTDYVWTSAENATSDGKLATFTFQIPDETAVGEYKIRFKVRDCETSDMQEVGLKVSTGTVTVITMVYGDANGDTLVDLRDVIRLMKYVAAYDFNTGKSTVEIFDGADANGDDTIDVLDAMRLMQYFASYDISTNTSTVQLGK